MDLLNASRSVAEGSCFRFVIIVLSRALVLIRPSFQDETLRPDSFCPGITIYFKYSQLNFRDQYAAHYMQSVLMACPYRYIAAG